MEAFVAGIHSRHILNDLWDKNAIIHCLSGGTLKDANGDDVGDIRDLLRRLDYFRDSASPLSG